MNRVRLGMGIAVLGVAVGLVALGLKSQDRKAVAPWDTDDSNAKLKGPAAKGDVGPVVEARDFEAILPGGVTIRFVGVSRDAYPHEPFRLADHSWSPAGGLYEEEEKWLEQTRNGDLGKFSPARYLTFRISAPAGQSYDTYGYIPGSPEPDKKPLTPTAGFDWPETNRMFGPDFVDRFGLVVPDLTADRYRYGIASGPWKTVATAKISGSPNPSKVLDKGPWGVLRMRGLDEQKPRPGEISKLEIPQIYFIAEPEHEPRKFSYRVRLLDQFGAEVGNRLTPGPVASCNAPTFSKVDRVDVEARPYTYVEFRNVHFNPDKAKWPDAYWGTEGEKAVSKDAATGFEFRGTMVLKPKNGFMVNAGIYAPDGKRWMDFPDSGFAQGFQMPDTPDWRGTRYALFKISAPETSMEAGPRLDLFAASSAVEEPATASAVWSTELRPSTNPVDVVMFKGPPGTKYLRARVLVPHGDWKVIGRVKPDRGPFMPLTPELKEAFKRGSVSCTVYRLIVRDNGAVESHVLPPNQIWRVSETALKIDRAKGALRVFARMKDGRRVMLSHNSISSIGDEFFEFDWTRDDRLILREKGPYLDEIESFEIEQLPYGKPVWLSAKLPT